MAYEYLATSPSVVYHLTKRENVERILRDGRIWPADGRECWFCLSIPEILRYMDFTVLNEGKPYVAADFTMRRYPKFVPEDHVILHLTPRYQSGHWVRWNQEFPPGASPETLARGEEFSRLKVGFRGVLKFRPDPEIIEVAPLLDRRELVDYIKFEEATSELFPWFVSAEEMLADTKKLDEVQASLSHLPDGGYDTDELREALDRAFGINPALLPNGGQEMYL